MAAAPLASRTVLVTGATSGIGLETVRQLAERGASVLVHGRTDDDARAAVDRLIATSKQLQGAQLHAVSADFAHLDEVAELARTVLAEYPHLDVLVNNAATAAPERCTLTGDGNEIAFQVNFLAHYLLTCLLEPALTAAPDGGRSSTSPPPCTARPPSSGPIRTGPAATPGSPRTHSRSWR